MSGNDPVKLITLLRPAVPEVDPVTRARALGQLADSHRLPRRSKSRRRLVAVAAAAAVILAVVTVIAVAPWTRTQTAEAAVADLVKTAAAQPAVKIGPRDWIVTRYTTVNTWTQNLTQEKLDRMSANAAAGMAAAQKSSVMLHADGTPPPSSEQAEVDRMNERRLERIRAGVKISDLPATHITYRTEAPWTSARNAAGNGGAGGGSNQIHYGSPEEKQAGKILQRAGIGGILSNPADLGAPLTAELPLRAVGDESDVEKLAADPAAMAAQLAKWKPVPEIDAESGAPRDLFVKAAGVVTSPYAAPAQRAAAIQMVAGLPGIEFARSARDSKGREGIGMSISIRGGKMQLVFDTDDSQLLGMQTRVDDAAAFIGKSWAGGGKDRVRLIPLFDNATIGVSYEPVTVRDGPPCSKTFCVGGGIDMPRSLTKKMRRMAESR